MKKITKKWVKFAKDDLKNAKILLKNKRYLGAIYYSHQTIEKFLKAILVEKKKKVPKTHDLLDLLKQTELPYPRETLEFLQELNPYYNPIRYPDAPEVVSLKLRRQKAEKILKLTQETIKWLKFQLNQVK